MVEEIHWCNMSLTGLEIELFNQAGLNNSQTLAEIR